MELIFSTGHYSTRISKNARILCNSAGNPPRLNFTAHPIKHPDSLEQFTMTPHMLDLDANRPEKQPNAWHYSLVVKNVSDNDFSLSLVAAPGGEGIDVEMPRGTIAPGDEGTINITIDPGLAEDLFTRSFTVEASDSANTRYTLPIMKSMRWGPAPLSSVR